jgi:DNA-binding transcriptional ArsR family regulator
MANIDVKNTGERDEAAVTQLVEQLAMTFADWGFPRMSARVLMSIMSTDEEGISALHLAERLGVTPPAISHAVRYLVQLGLLERIPVPGSRRDLYRMTTDTWYATSMSREGVYSTIAELAEEGVPVLGGPATPSGARMREMAEFYRFVREEMAGLLDKWQAVKADRLG